MTERQVRFVDYYIQTANASEAARLAGYSERTAYSIGERLLRNVEVRAAIDERLKEMEDKRIIETEEVLRHLSDVIRGAVTETLVTPGGKKFVVPVRESDRLRAAETILKVRGMFREKIDVKVDSMAQYISSLEKVWAEDADTGTKEIPR